MSISYYFRNRYYDPELRRWISEDPIGFNGGINLYAYVGNDPVNYSDPWGLQEECPPYATPEGPDDECIVDHTYGIGVSVRRLVEVSLGGALGLGRGHGLGQFVNRVGDLFGYVRGGIRFVERVVTTAVTQCSSELASLALATTADALFFTGGGLVATGRLGGLAANALASGGRQLGRRAFFGALAPAPLAVDGALLGGGVMQVGVPWQRFLSMRTTAAAHTVMGGRGFAPRDLLGFLPGGATFTAGRGLFQCVAEAR